MHRGGQLALGHGWLQQQFTVPAPQVRSSILNVLLPHVLLNTRCTKLLPLPQLLRADASCIAGKACSTTGACCALQSRTWAECPCCSLWRIFSAGQATGSRNADARHGFVLNVPLLGLIWH